MRRGVTLVELLVAMALAGIVTAMVGGWIVHSAHLSSRSQARDDRAQELSLLRSAIFQDGTRGHAVLVARRGWSVEIPRADGTADTAAWTVADGSVRRSGRTWLSSDTVVEQTLVPLRSGADPALDPWPEIDRNLDGEVDPEWLPRLDALEWILVVRRRDFLSGASLLDTLHLSIPLRGPG